MIEIKNVSKKFGNREIINNFSCSLPDKGFVSLVGHSGCGKTTLLNMIAGVDQNFDGSVLLDGTNLKDLKSGDEVGVFLSGSFPALNISVLCAIQEYGLKPCVMASIGASTYGANYPEFTILDMIEYLNKVAEIDETEYEDDGITIEYDTAKNLNFSKSIICSLETCSPGSFILSFILSCAQVAFMTIKNTINNIKKYVFFMFSPQFFIYLLKY